MGRPFTRHMGTTHHLPLRAELMSLSGRQSKNYDGSEQRGEVRLSHLPMVTQTEVSGLQRVSRGFCLIPPDPAWHKVYAQ